MTLLEQVIPTLLNVKYKIQNSWYTIKLIMENVVQCKRHSQLIFSCKTILQTKCAPRNFMQFFLWLLVTFYTNFFKFPDFVWVFMTCLAENILFPGFSDHMNPVLVKMRLSYRTISPKRCIVTYFWVNWVFNCLIVSRLGSTILWKLMKFC